MTSIDVRPKILELVGAYCTIPATDDAPLDVDSLSLIQLVEELEIAFDLRVLPSEASPENFGSVARILAFVGAKKS